MLEPTPPDFPFLALLVSGGHTLLAAVRGVGEYEILGSSVDDAVGEAFDKTAKLLGLPYPGGPQIESLARMSRPGKFALPRPMKGRDGADFSFSGLKTAVRQVVSERGPLGEADRASLAADFQAAVVDVLTDRVRSAMRRFRTEFGSTISMFPFVAAGGVAANQPIRVALQTTCGEEGFALLLPPIELCTDNGAMVAWAGLERFAVGSSDPLDSPPRARWPLDS